jgi:hypothetical protein
MNNLVEILIKFICLNLNHLKTNNKTLLLKLFMLVILIFSLAQATFGVIPNIHIYETGNLTNNSLEGVHGNVSFQTGLEYIGTRIVIGDNESFIPEILPSENFVYNFTNSNYHTGILEIINDTKNKRNITRIYNLTNLFNTTINVTSIINVAPNEFCAYKNYSSNLNISDITKINNSFHLNFSMGPLESSQFNFSCETQLILGFFYWDASHYNITSYGDEIFSDYGIKILPDLHYSTTKERVSSNSNDLNSLGDLTNWTVYFNLENKGDITINLSKIRLWATPAENTTQPEDNIIVDKNYTSCLSGKTISQPGDLCCRALEFSSKYVPVVWSEVFFENIFNITIDNFYTFEGFGDYFYFSDYIVRLLEPINWSVVDIGENVEFKFGVQNYSNCSFYTNISGNFTKMGDQPNLFLENVTLYNSFYYTVPDNEILFDWNVYCVRVDGKEEAWNPDNWTLYVNALPRFYEDIPDFTWDEDTNITINFTDYVYDIEGDDFNLSLLPVNVLNISYDINDTDDSITFVPDENWYGNRLVRLYVHDPYNRTVNSKLFLLNVSNVPDAPEIIWWNASNATYHTTDLNVTFRENETITFEAEAYDVDLWDFVPDNLFLWFIDGIMKGIGKMFDWAVGWFDAGQHNVTLVINDSNGLNTSLNWNVTINNLNRPPKYNEIPTIFWPENSSRLINLSYYFYDLDLEELNYSLESIIPNNISIILDNLTKTANFISDLGWIGNDSAQIKAIDIYNATNISNIFNLTVYPRIIKNAPITQIIFYEDSYNDSLNLSNYFNDLLYDKSEASWSINGSDNISVLINLLTWQVNFTSTQDWYGNETILFNVLMDNGYYDNESVNITVLPINDAPIINSAHRLIYENQEPVNPIFDLWNYSYDVDNTYEELDYNIISNSNSTLLDCYISDDRYINCFAPLNESWGDIYLNVSVSDGEFTKYDLFNITIYHYDIAPIIDDWVVTNSTFDYKKSDFDVNEILNIYYYEDDLIDFDVSFYDIENDSLLYAFTLDNLIVKSGNVTNSTIFLQDIDYSKYFDFHSSGKHVLKLKLTQTNGRMPGRYTEISWILHISNLNRVPLDFNLTYPENGHYFTNPNLNFSWMTTTDPDEINHNDDDYWNVFYKLQIDDDVRFYSMAHNDEYSSNSTGVSFVNYPDDVYYWRVIASDGYDGTMSEIRYFIYDGNIPDVSLEINPNPAEYLYRDVDIIWSAYDKYLSNYYLNISYPNGTLLGQYKENLTLTPQNLTVMGDYELIVFAQDDAGNYAIDRDVLTLINDTTAPEITLKYPAEFYRYTTSSVALGYEFDDYANLKNCSLYLQKINQYFDILGDVLYEYDLESWHSVKTEHDIPLGLNDFNLVGLSDSTYRWNVRCFDVAGNEAWAQKNWTFDVRTSLVEEPVPEVKSYESSERIIGDSSGYNLRIDIPNVQAHPGKMVTVNITIENTGELDLGLIRLIPSVDWVSITRDISGLKSGNKISIPITIYTPYDLGEIIYHIIARSTNAESIGSGHLNIMVDYDEAPIYVTKNVFWNSELSRYDIEIQIINSLDRNIRIYLEDYLTGMSGIVLNGDNLDYDKTYPPSIIMSDYILSANEIRVLKYSVNNLNLEKITKPFVMTDEDVIDDLIIYSPIKTNVVLFSKITYEYILIILLFLTILIFIFRDNLFALYYNHQKK